MLPFPARSRAQEVGGTRLDLEFHHLPLQAGDVGMGSEAKVVMLLKASGQSFKAGCAQRLVLVVAAT